MPPKPKKTLNLPAGPAKRLEVTYKGRVQGVGFRFNVEKVALEVGAKGWVRNEKNGDVMMVAEGPESVLMALLEGVRQCQVGRYISKEHIRWEIPLNGFDDFTIEYHF
ncbi:MAG: acylphosphatase [Candidatus Omnitrophica bacterium]|nr:acylphosphatase [Candidatus Omnitrophota bacterium]